MTTTINRKRRISSTIAQAEPLGKEMNGKTRRMCAFLVVLTGFAVVASIFIGSRFIPIGQMLSALNGTGNQELHSIVWDLRMPRTFLAFAAGAALAVAGILAQAGFVNWLGLRPRWHGALGVYWSWIGSRAGHDDCAAYG